MSERPDPLAAPAGWREVTRGELDDGTPIAVHVPRDDPLAPPEGYGSRPADDGPDLTRCAMITGPGSGFCGTPPDCVIWIGCQDGEHAGPCAYCRSHGQYVITMGGSLTCGQCGAAMKILKITDMEGQVLAPHDVYGTPRLWQDVNNG